MHGGSLQLKPEATQRLQCSSFLGLLWFFGKELEYTTQKGTTSEPLGRV